MAEGKWRAEDKGGSGKRWRVEMVEMEGVEWRWAEGGAPQLGAQVIEPLRGINTCLSAIKGELAACWEAVAEELTLLH